MGRKPVIAISDGQTTAALVERARRAREQSSVLIARIREMVGSTRQHAEVARELTLDMKVEAEGERRNGVQRDGGERTG